MIRRATWHATRFAAAAMPALLLLAGCTLAMDPADRIGLVNGTDTPVAVHVNGGWAGTYPPGAVANVSIRGHGGPPFRIEVRSPSGAMLSGVTISAQDAAGVAEGSSSMSVGGAVPCGWIELSYGESADPVAPPVQPRVPPAPATGPCP